MKKGVNVVITDNQNRVLVLKRSLSSGFSPGLWDFPGGEVEDNESLEQAVIREAKEETNLEVELGDNYFYIYYYPNGKQKNATAVVYAFRTKLIGGKIKLSKEHTGFKWVSKDNWKGLDYTPSVATTLEELFR